MSKLVVGCGYLGQRVARFWRDSGDTVHVVTRSSRQANQWKDQGFLPIVQDITHPQGVDAWPEAETVLFAVGYDRSSGKTIDDVYVNGLRNVLETLPVPQRMIYISTTGVYGQTDGQWVDEQSECVPTRAGGIACLRAEQLIENSPFAPAAVVLRLAGIYGDGRVPRKNEILAGKPIPASSGFLNLIHVEDAARIIVEIERCRSASHRYIVSDNQPVLRTDYYAEVARILNAPRPQFDTPDPQSPAGLRATTDKRVSARKLIGELKYRFLYPSFREGLRQILGDG